MKAEELSLIQSKHNAAIIAPAGHGKTEMITDLVDKLPGKKLVLTHTNAGISALRQRLARKQICSDKYYLKTISSFCMQWCRAYPVTAKIDLSKKITDSGFYNEQYCGTARIFMHDWARYVLKQTYACVIVDEYQDCIIEQHKIFLEINKTIPVYILGDPLQSIFGWAGTPVSWKDMEFEIIDIETAPYRWNKTNSALGKYLTKVRHALMPALEGKRVTLSTVPRGSYIKRISLSDARGGRLLNELNLYQSALYLTKWPKDQCSFALRTGGIFQNDEPQNLSDLDKYVPLLESEDGCARAEAIFCFIAACATQVGAELGSYEKHIKDRDFNFSRIRKHQEFGDSILGVYGSNNYDELLRCLNWIKKIPKFRIYRRELYAELIRAIRFAKDNGIKIHEAVRHIRMLPDNSAKYAGFKKLSSRVVLSKGLEFECVAINLEEKYTATEMYVAMTRATKALYFITDKATVTVDVPE